MKKRKTDLVVTGYIFNSKNKLLLIHHKKRDMWLPVGGHMEENETPDEALLREIAEETNLRVEIWPDEKMPLEGDMKKHLAIPFHVNVHSVGDHDHCSFFYTCRALNESDLKINNELKGFKWVSKNELEDEAIPKDVRNIALRAFD